MEVLDKQPFVWPGFCLWVTRSLLQRGAEDGLQELPLSDTANLDEGKNRECIPSSRKHLVYPGPDGEMCPQRANHNTQNEWRKCPVEYVPCCATRAGLRWAGHAASQQACVTPASEILFFKTERMENCNCFNQILHGLQCDPMHWIHHWPMFNQEVKGYTEQFSGEVILD